MRLLSILIITLALTTHASAQNPLDKAVEIANQAAELFQNGSYLAAAEKFDEAFQIYPDPTLLKNQIVAYYRADRCDKAQEVSTQYAQVSDEQLAADVEDIRFVQVECLWKQASDAFTANDLTAAQVHIQSSRQLALKAEEQTRLSELEEQIEERKIAMLPPPPPEKSILLPVVGWSATGVGLVALGVAGGLHLSYVNDYNNYRNDTDNPLKITREQWCREHEPEACNKISAKYRKTETKINKLIPLYIAGGVVAAGGIATLVYHYYFADNDTTLTPVVGPDHIGVQFGLQF